MQRWPLPRVAPLIAALADDPSPSVRAVAGRALGLLKDVRARGPLRQALDDPDWEVRIVAADRLQALDELA